MDVDNDQGPTKRPRKACERCRRRKQRCYGFPTCSNCQLAKEECIQPPSAIEEYKSGTNHHALLERLSFLEAQLSNGTYTNTVLEGGYEFRALEGGQTLLRTPTITKSKEADVVGLLNLGCEGAYLGLSSGFSLASSLGQMVQATVWNKALASTASEDHQKAVSLAEVKRQSASPPNDDIGARILDAYFSRTHLRYPFLDRSDIIERHANRFTQDNNSIQDQFGTFKIYMVYAIGATQLKLTGPYNYTAPESFFMTALQFISAARESHLIYNIQAMTLLVLYNLRSPSNSGIWYMIGLAMRTCVDLGLHREYHYTKIRPYEGQLRRRLFWSIYFLERNIATSLSRPYSIADRDIDVLLPLEIDDTVTDDALIAQKMATAPPPAFKAARPPSNLALGIQCISLMRQKSHIQTTIYRIDRPISSLVPKIASLLQPLETWHSTLPPATPFEVDYLDIHYYKAIRHLIQPFLTILAPDDHRIATCLHASGQICQIYKRLHQRDSYSHSFIALHSVFNAGITMCYTLFLYPALWTFTVSNDLRACSSALFVMAERTPVVRKYRDALEAVISATMEFMARSSSTAASPHPNTQNGGTSTNNKKRPANLQSEDQQGSHYRDSSSSFPHLDSQNYLAPSLRESPKQPPTQFLPSNLTFTPDYTSWQPNQFSSPVTPSRQPQPQPEFQPQSPSRGSAFKWPGNSPNDEQHVDVEWLLSLCEGGGFSLDMLHQMMNVQQSMDVEF